jgi:hypothetical protein
MQIQRKYFVCKQKRVLIVTGDVGLIRNCHQHFLLTCQVMLTKCENNSLKGCNRRVRGSFEK